MRTLALTRRSYVVFCGALLVVEFIVGSAERLESLRSAAVGDFTAAAETLASRNRFSCWWLAA